MKRILVCLDASPRAPSVLAAAADLAQRTGARMSLLRAVGIPPELNKIVSVDLGANVIETLQAKAKEDLDLLAQDVPKSLIEGIHVHVGTPWDTICREAKLVDCDVVVLGSHGYGGFDRVLGTTAAKVVNHCDRSVFVVRERPRETS
jgi:universal stress protein F